MKTMRSFCDQYDIVPQSTDTQSLARDTPQCARFTLVIVIYVRDRAWFVRLYGR